MKAEYDDIFILKNQLWKLRLEKCSKVKTRKWTLGNLRSALKSLKNNKSRDSLGMIAEIFKPGTIGEELELAVLSLMNSIKSDNLTPNFM